MEFVTSIKHVCHYGSCNLVLPASVPRATSRLHGCISWSDSDTLLFAANVAQANSRGAGDPLA